MALSWVSRALAQTKDCPGISSSTPISGTSTRMMSTLFSWYVSLSLDLGCRM